MAILFLHTLFSFKKPLLFLPLELRAHRLLCRQELPLGSLQLVPGQGVQGS